MARPERFELPTKWFEATYSIQLSYGRKEVDSDLAAPPQKVGRSNTYKPMNQKKNGGPSQT
jgi:hypothetical protein